MTALRHARAVQIVLGATQFLVLVDSLMVAVALPAIDRDIELSPTELPWVINAYTLALAGGLLVAGRAADVYGRRRLLLLGLGGLVVATVVAAAAPSGPVLVGARAAQGLAAALAYPSSLALVPTLFPDEPERGRTFAIVGAADGLGAVVGAVAGGVVTGLLGWRWVFLVTVPLGLFALVVARTVLPADRERRRGRIDVPGAVLVTAGLTSVVYAVIQVEHAGLDSAHVVVPVFVGVASLAAFVRIERRAAAPLVRLGLLRVRSLAGAAVGIAATSAVYSAVVFVGSLYLQQSRGYGAATTGLAFLPLTVVGVAVSLAGGRLVGRLGHRRVAIASLGTGAASLVALAAAATTDAPYAALILPALIGAGVAGYGSWVALVALAARDVDHGERAVASSMFEASIHVGGAISVAILATVLAGTASYATTFGVGAVLALAGAAASGLILRGARRPAAARQALHPAAK